MLFHCRIRLRLLFNSRSGIGNLIVHKPLVVSPKRIVYCALRDFFRKDMGTVMGGDWDLLEKRFEDSDVYTAFKDVFFEGKDWEETALYRHILDPLNEDKAPWHCRSESDFQKRCKDVESLFHTIKKEGYQSQLTLSHSGLNNLSGTLYDEVAISIGRHGDLLFNDGRHRLATAKLLGLEKIPAVVAVRHKEWMVFVNELLQYTKSLGGKLYQPAMHPDLENIPASHHCEDRFLMIRRRVSTSKGRVLDIGANLGYFSHRFEEEGFDCYAAESNDRECYYLRKLRRAENRKFKIIPGSIFDWSQCGQIYFDVVLALNVFHHALKTKENYEKLVLLLRNLRMGELFFETIADDEPQMIGAYRNYSESEFLDFITRLSMLKHVELIGTADGRKIYRFFN